jgi:hypothetical protein
MFLVAADRKKLHPFPPAQMTVAAVAAAAEVSTFFSATGATAAAFIVSTWFL